MTGVLVALGLALGGELGCDPRPGEVSPPSRTLGETRHSPDDAGCPPDRVRRLPPRRTRRAPAVVRPVPGFSCESQGCFAWAGWSARGLLHGGAATLTVHAPRVGPGEHAIAELAIRGGREQADVLEIGWEVAPRIYDDLEPHLLVARWRAGAPCDGTCAFHPWSSAYAAGMSLSDWTGRAVRVGWLLDGGRWWAWFEGGWLGWFEMEDWNPPLKVGTGIQWFGEVLFTARSPDVPMGSGHPARSLDAARFERLCLVEDDGPCRPPRGAVPRVTAPAVYDLEADRPDAFRYGGPGVARELDVTPRPPPSAASAGTPEDSGTSARARPP